MSRSQQCSKCSRPAPGSSTLELLAWAKRVGRQEALKEVLEKLRLQNASDVMIAAINHAILEEEKYRERG
jgi:hypothetical protein